MEDTQVNEEDLKKVEEEILEKKKSTEERLKAEIEAKIKKEMAEEKAKQEKEDLVKKLTEEKNAMEALLKEKELKAIETIESLQAKIGQSKAIHNPTQNTQTEKPPAAKDLTQEQLKEINDGSEEALLQHWGLPKSHFRLR